MNEHTEAVVRYIPYLRRYARALTGTQARGDGYVRGCLELILAEPEQLGAGEAKLELFKAFHKVWDAVHTTLFDKLRAGSAEAQETPSFDDKNGIPRIERQMLLLVYLEGFSVSEAAEIVGVVEQSAEELLARARTEIKDLTGISILIIEDETLIAMDIARIVEEMGHSVCASVARESDAVEAAAREHPGLILADIQLQDGESGIRAVQNIMKTSNVPVIFVTGFPERLLTGDTLEPVFLITKPFDPDTLKVAIGQALSLSAPAK